MMAKWKEIFPPGWVIPETWEYGDIDPDVDIVVDGLPMTFSAQYTGVTRSGERTIHTFLDQIVFGVPLTGFDLWQKSHLHEVSRRLHQGPDGRDAARIRA